MNLEERKEKLSFLTGTPSSTIEITLEKCSIALKMLIDHQNSMYTFPGSQQFFMDFILEKELFRLFSLKDKTPSQTLLGSMEFWSIIDCLFNSYDTLPIVTKPIIPIFTNYFSTSSHSNLNPLVIRILRNLSSKNTSLICKTTTKYMIDFIDSLTSLCFDQNSLTTSLNTASFINIIIKASLEVVIVWGRHSGLFLKNNNDFNTLLLLTNILKDECVAEKIFDTFFFCPTGKGLAVGSTATTLISNLRGDNTANSPINKEAIRSFSVETRFSFLLSFSKAPSTTRNDVIFLFQKLLTDLRKEDEAHLLKSLSLCSFGSIQNDEAFATLSATVIPSLIRSSYDQMIAILEIDLSLLLPHLPKLLKFAVLEREDLREVFVERLTSAMSEIRQLPELIEFIIDNDASVLFSKPLFDGIARHFLKRLSLLHKTILFRLWDSLSNDVGGGGGGADSDDNQQELRYIFLSLLAYQPVLKEKALSFTSPNADLQRRINFLYCMADDITSLPSILRREKTNFTFLDEDDEDGLEKIFKSSVFWESLSSINDLLSYMMKQETYYSKLKLLISLTPVNLSSSFEIKGSLAFELLYFIILKENNHYSAALVEKCLLRLLCHNQKLTYSDESVDILKKKILSSSTSPLLKGRFQDRLGSFSNFLFTEEDSIAMEVWFEQMLFAANAANAIIAPIDTEKLSKLRMNPKTFLKFIKLLKLAEPEGQIEIPSYYGPYDRMFIASHLPDNPILREKLMGHHHATTAVDLLALWEDGTIKEGDQAMLARLMKIYPVVFESRQQPQQSRQYSISFLEVLLKECPSMSFVFDDNIDEIEAAPEQWIKVIHLRLMAGGTMIGRLKEVAGLFEKMFERLVLSVDCLMATKTTLTKDLFRSLCSCVRLIIQYHLDNGPFAQDGKGILMTLIVGMMNYCKNEPSYIRGFSKLIMDLSICLHKKKEGANPSTLCTISYTVIIPIILNWCHFSTLNSSSSSDGEQCCCDEMKQIMIPSICSLIRCLDIYSSKLSSTAGGGGNDDEKFFKTAPFERLVQLTAEDSRVLMRQIISLYESDYKYEGKV